jgi:FtsP/CotA-like multicopper oxidase with cupredoxin domain
MTVNWLDHPYFDVRARRYRFRILNSDVSRFMRLALVVARDGSQGELAGETSSISYDRVPFHMIANDGNIMEHAVPHDGTMDLDYDGELSDHHGVLPTLSIAERYDIVVDFGRYEPGSKIYMVNLLEHKDGRGPNREIPLAQILDGTHDSCDSAVGRFLEIRVHPFSGKDLSMNPADYIPGRKTMIPLPTLNEEEIRSAVHHTFRFGTGGLADSRPRNLSTDFYPSPSGEVFVEGEASKDEGRELPFRSPHVPNSDNPLKDLVEECVAYDLEDTDSHLLGEGLAFNDYMNGVPRFSIIDKENVILPFHNERAWGISSDGGLQLATDMHRVSAAPVLGGLEIWHLENEGAMWSHNVHIHFEEGRILRRDGKAPPEWEKWARKDVYRIGSMDDSGASVDVALRFREFAGSYMSHCHNTTHEDHAMMLRFDVENPGQLKPFLTPEPQWNGTSYSQSHEEDKASQRSDTFGDALGKREFNQNDIAAMLCPPGATAGCPGAISASSVAHQSQDLCDADKNGQIDVLDLFQIIREPSTKEDGSALIDWGSCASKCTHKGCSPLPPGGRGRCGLLGIEGLLVLLPLALRRKRRQESR